ncbi:MAG: choice-of-anchor L domain-containing protein [Crocinitomicaceae bacterium]|nr:choice-of-anchor L domain-containing protein [Crocinitomicaceae bacterium]
MKYLIYISAILFPFFSMGQLTTSTAQSPAGLVQNVLLGSGVSVSNITFNGAPISIGEFDGSACNVGLNSGVVMTTGTVINSGTGDGPHGPNNKPDSGIDNGAPGLGLLSNLVGGTGTYNAAVLEFDFVPYSDTVRFNYVFGSEEYPEYVGSTFNDVFGFFISGPGILGGMQNIAKLPNGDVVAINNVNAITNPFYFVNNGDGSSAPQNGSSNFIQYDGFTQVLTAESEVQCGETYHLIIAIADVGDEIFDSGIFLEANSLSSKTPVEISHTMSQNLFANPNTMAEGCVTTTVTLERGTNDLASPMTIPINLSGSAIELVDYSDIPASVTFPAGVQTVSFTFNAFQDGIVEGQENILITLPLLDPCGNLTPLVLELFIEDIQDVDVDVQGGTINCPGEEVTLTATPSGGAAPYTYLWAPGGQTTQSITVTPGATTMYSVSVTDDCLNQTATDNFEVVVPVLPPLVLNETPDITEICPYLPETLEANPTGGSGNYTYQWSSNFDPNLGTTATIDIQPPTTTTYTVTVMDDCGNSVTENIVYTITSPPLTLTMSPDVEICPGDSIEISVIPDGGFGSYFFLWPHSGETTQSVYVHPNETTTYFVIVSDECQTFVVNGSVEVAIVKPTANFTISSETVFNNLPIQFENLTVNGTTYVWDFGDNNGSTDVHPSNIYSEPGFYDVTLIAYDDKGCTDTIMRPIEIEEEWYIYVPNAFTPDGDRFNNDFRISTVGIQTLSIAIYNRWGEAVFTSNELDFIWDGTYTGLYVPDGVYTYKIEFLTNSERRKTIAGHVNVLR